MNQYLPCSRVACLVLSLATLTWVPVPAHCQPLPEREGATPGRSASGCDEGEAKVDTKKSITTTGKCIGHDCGGRALKVSTTFQTHTKTYSICRNGEWRLVCTVGDSYSTSCDTPKVVKCDVGCREKVQRIPRVKRTTPPLFTPPPCPPKDFPLADAEELKGVAEATVDELFVTWSDSGHAASAAAIERESSCQGETPPDTVTEPILKNTQPIDGR